MNSRQPRFAARTRGSLAVGFALLFSAAGVAEPPAGDPIFRNLFPPDLVFRHADAIGLTPQQREAMMNVLREARGQGEPHHQKIREASQKLGSLLQEPVVNEEQMLAQLDAVLLEERVIKRSQLTMLARIKNQLSPQQQEKLRSFVGSQAPAQGAQGFRQQYEQLNQHLADMHAHFQGDAAGDRQFRSAIGERLQKIRAGVERWRKEGRDPTPVVELMKQFAARMRAGQLREAGEQVDQAIKTLEDAPPRSGGDAP